MSIVVAQYVPDEFNVLPDPVLANTRLSAGGGESVVHSDFKALFDKHGMSESFGLCLLHRHYDMEEDERFVELNKIACPWTVDDVREADGYLVPRSWKFTESGMALVPIEFEYFREGEASPHINAEETLKANSSFIEELKKTLDKFNLREVLGLRVWPGEGFRGFYETSTSRLTITFPPAKDKTGVNTAWFFHPEFVKFGCVCPCAYQNGGHTGKHKGHRTTT